MFKFHGKRADRKDMIASTLTTATRYSVKVEATTAREAIEYTRRILPVTVSQSTNLTARRTSNSTFEVYA